MAELWPRQEVWIPFSDALENGPAALPRCHFLFRCFDAYKTLSNASREIFYRYTDLIEPLSLDEAYLDVTTDKLHIGSAIDIAKLIKQSINDELQLTASAGISINKFVAKIASDMDKQNGLTFIGPSQIESFLEKLAVEKFHGVGKVTAAKMKGMGLHNGADLKKLSETELLRHFGKVGMFYYNIVRGVDEREVQPHRETKSVSVEGTIQEDLSSRKEMETEFLKLTEKLVARLQKNGLKGKTVTVKIRLSDFSIITRSCSLAFVFSDTKNILGCIGNILDRAMLEGRKISLLGIGLSNFENDVELPADNTQQNQLSLF